MSRGFVKELEEIPDPVMPDADRERRYTARGLAALESLLAATNDPVRRSDLERTIGRAVVPALPKDRSRCAFGATVTVTGVGRGERRYTIVGEDEIDIAAGFIGSGSPLALALDGAAPGESVVWHRPSGDVRLTVRAVSYEA